MSLPYIVCLYDDDYLRRTTDFLWFLTSSVVLSTNFPLSSQTRYFQQVCAGALDEGIGGAVLSPSLLSCILLILNNES